MKKRNIFLFFILFCLIFIGFEIWSRQIYNGSSWRVYQNLEENSLDILFIGNSHSYTTFDPKIVNNAFDVESFNLGTPNATLPLIYYEMKKALKTQNPEYIILESYVFDAIEKKSLHSNYLHRAKFDLDDISLLYNILEPSLYYYYFVTSTFHDVYWKDPTIFITDKKIDDYKKYPNYLGFEPNSTIIPKKDYQFLIERNGTLEKHDIANYDFYRTYLEKIINLCETKNIKLVLVSAPVVSDFRNNPDIFLYDIEKLVNDYNIPYINLDDNALGLSRMNYYNSGHLTKMGALNATVEFVKRFSNDFNIIFDEEYISKFSDYNFNNYSANISNGNLIIDLIPKNENPKNEMIFSWDISYAGEKFLETTTNPQVTIDINNFELSKTVSVYVQVNSNGADYPLHVYFDIPLSVSDISW